MINNFPMLSFHPENTSFNIIVGLLSVVNYRMREHHNYTTIVLGDRMFLGMQDFGFAQI